MDRHKTVRMPRQFFVYLMSNRWRTLYVGVTNNIYRRIHEHRTGSASSFARRDGIDRLVYVESGNHPRDAIAREKQIKGWSRQKKLDLIESANTGWADLAANWFEDTRSIPYRDSKDSSLRSE